MFGKKRCSRCGEKVEKKYNFCPYCRAPLNEGSNDEDWGLLGKDDSFEPEQVKLPMGFNALFNSLVKNFDKQFKEMEKDIGSGAKDVKPTQPKKSVKGGISISISTANGRAPEIKVTSFGNPEVKKAEQENKKVKAIKLPSSDSGKFAGLPKKEPETTIRRLSDKVVYEMNLPGVKSVKDISIVQLENSVEIKALAKDKVFYKVIPINLPITNYSLERGKLVLELDSKD